MSLWKEMQNLEGMQLFLYKYAGIAALVMMVLSIVIICLIAVGYHGVWLGALGLVLMVVSSIWIVGWFRGL